MLNLTISFQITFRVLYHISYKFSVHNAGHMDTKSERSVGITLAFSMIAIAVAAILSVDATLTVYVQNATTTPAQTQAPTPQTPTNQTVDPQQIKNYLNQAIQALDSGNNTKALEQVDLADDQLESMTGAESVEDEDDDEEEEGEIEERPGEDEDEPGDIDTNDEEDSP
jgi:hypothetical protein